MKVTGYLRVKTADDFEFSLWAADAGRLTIGSTVVIDSDGDHRHAEEKRGSIHLKPGVHPFTIVYSHDTSGDQTLQFVFPKGKVAAFAGIEILTYATLSNHLHILLQVPERVELSEEEVLERITGLYGRVRTANVVMELQTLREQDRHDEAAALIYGYTHRMYDLSEYMKMVMQRFTQSYNRRHGRRGPLWEDRFKSILVEGTADALSTKVA